MPSSPNFRRENIRMCLNGIEEVTRADDYITANHAGDFELNPSFVVPRPLIPAAVLVPLVEHEQGFTVLLTQRTEHLNDHAGQISFPGGRQEDMDDGSIATALRETREEIGLDPEFIQIAGCLDPYQTGTGYLITPVVGFVALGFELTIDEFEVAEVFEVPLSFILDEENHRTEKHWVRGVERRYHVIEYENYYIWGATAGMLMNLCRRISTKPE